MDACLREGWDGRLCWVADLHSQDQEPIPIITADISNWLCGKVLITRGSGAGAMCVTSKQQKEQHLFSRLCVQDRSVDIQRLGHEWSTCTVAGEPPQ